MSNWTADGSPGMAISREPKGAEAEGDPKAPVPQEKRKRVVVVGLGMVGIAFV